jgi:hypothetical protein
LLVRAEEGLNSRPYHFIADAGPIEVGGPFVQAGDFQCGGE